MEKESQMTPVNPGLTPADLHKDLGIAWNGLADAMHLICTLNVGDKHKEFERLHAYVEQAHGAVQQALPFTKPPKAPPEPSKGRRLRELAEDLLRSAINIAEEKSPKWYKNSDEKIAAILALKDQWDTEAAKIGREVLPPESPTHDEFPIDPNVFPTAQKAIEGALHDIVYEEWPEVNHLAPRMAETVVKYLESASWELVKKAKPGAGDTVPGTLPVGAVADVEQILIDNFEAGNPRAEFGNLAEEIVKMVIQVTPGTEAGKP